MLLLLLLVVLGISAVVGLMVAGVVFIAKGLTNADSPPYRDLAGAEEFKCGVAGLAPTPIYTSYPLAKLLVAEHIMGVRTPALGDLMVRKGAPYSIAEGRGVLGATITINAERRQLRVKLSKKDLRRVAAALDSASWEHRL